MKSIAIPAGLLLAAGTAGHAQPATMVVAETPYTERMGYQPSALASEDGLRGLKSRVRRAARRVCELGIDIPTPNIASAVAAMQLYRRVRAG